MKNLGTREQRIKNFAFMRRKWFAFCFIASLVMATVYTSKRFDSAIEILGLATIGALVLTTLISLASAPAIWILSASRKDKGS